MRVLVLAAAIAAGFASTALAQPAPADPCPTATAHAAANAPSETRAALEACLAAEGVAPADQALLQRRLGDAHALLENGLAAIAAYDRAEALMREAETPVPPLMIASRGRAYQLTRQPERALADLSAALEVRPNWDRTRYHRALVLLTLHRADEAIEDLRRVARGRIAPAEANTTLAGVLLGRGDEAGALTAAEAAIAARAEQVAAHQIRCQALIGLGRREDAAMACDRALQLAPGDEVTARNLAAAREALAQPAR